MKIIIWSTFYFMTFLCLVVGLYYGRQKVAERTKDMPILGQTPYHIEMSKVDSSAQQVVDPLSVVMEGLLGQISVNVMELQKRDSTVQALQTELANVAAQGKSLIQEVESLKREIEEKVDRENRIQDLAKTLGAMKSDVLAPILANLPDDMISIVYDKAKAKDRTKIFNSLAPARTGRIMRKMAGDGEDTKGK